MPLDMPEVILEQLGNGRFYLKMCGRWRPVDVQLSTRIHDCEDFATVLKHMKAFHEELSVRGKEDG